MRRLIGTVGVVAVLVATLVGVAPGAAQAATAPVCTWSSSSSTDLNAPANYTDSSGSPSCDPWGAQLVFPATDPGSGFSLSLTGDLVVDSIELDGSYTLGGAHTLTVSTSIVASADATIAANVAFGSGSLMLAAAAGSTLTVTGTVTTDSGGALVAGQSAMDGTVLLAPPSDAFATSNYWFGSTTVAYGTLKAGTEKAVSIYAPLDVEAGATLDLNGSLQLIQSLTGDGTGTITDTHGGGTLELETGNDPLILTEAVSGSANIIVATNSGSVTLSPPLPAGNSYTGSTLVYGYGALVINDASALGSTSGVTLGNTDFGAPGTLDLEGTIELGMPIAIRIGAVEVTGTDGVTGAANTATLTGKITVGVANTTYTGALAAATGDTLAVGGAVTGTTLYVGSPGMSGTVTMSGDGSSLYQTEVEAGTLGLSGKLGGVTVDAGATLEGTGTVSGLSVLSGGTLIPGESASSPGTFTSTGDFYLQSGSTLAIDIAGTADYSKLASSGGQTNSGTGGNLEVTVDPSYAVPVGATFQVVSATYMCSTFANAPDGTVLGVGSYSFRVSYSPALGGNCEPTAVTLTAVGAPSAPSGVVATVQTSGHGKSATKSVTLAWTAPANDGGAAITGYLVNVYAAGHGKNGGYTLVSSAPLDTGSTELTFTVPDSAFSGGGTYAFTVAAVNGVGTGAYSDYSNTIRY